jgi:hypothetical protein
MRANTTSRDRAGFSLTEVLVAVPLLVLVFWICGNIFVTTRDTVELGMIHSKVTASAESAVQRFGRDVAGMRIDGRLVVLAGRINKRTLGKDDSYVAGVASQFPGTWGQMAFIAQGTFVSQFQYNDGLGNSSPLKSTLARIWYYPAKRVPVADPMGAGLPNKYDYWNCDVILRNAMLFCYVSPTTTPIAAPPAATQADEAAPFPIPGVPDVLAYRASRVTVAGLTQVVQRQDLLKRACESMRIADPLLARNNNGAFPLASGQPNFDIQTLNPQTGAMAWEQFWNPNDSTPATVAAAGRPINPNHMLQVLLVRAGLIDNGRFAPPDGYSGGPYTVTDLTTQQPVNLNYYPPGVPPIDPNPNAAAKDPGAASMFQVWAREAPAGADNWLPRGTDVPAGGYWGRKYMYIRDQDDQNEFAASGGSIQNRAVNANPSIPWPKAVRFNFHIFDKVGRFKQGALFQAVVEVPSSRL